MSTSEPALASGAAEPSLPPGPSCPEHPSSASVRPCTRCGGFTCDHCTDADGSCAACRRRALAALPLTGPRANWAVRFLVASGLASVLELAVSVAVNAGAAAEAVAPIQILVGLWTAAALLGAGITYLRWLHLMVRVGSAHGIDPGATPGWAVAYWFIPFVNLYRPYRVVKALAEGLGGPDLVQSAGVTAWWALWILTGITERIHARTLDKDPNFALGVLANLLSVGAAIFAVRVLRALDLALQERRARAASPG